MSEPTAVEAAALEKLSVSAAPANELENGHDSDAASSDDEGAAGAQVNGGERYLYIMLCEMFKSRTDAPKKKKKKSTSQLLRTPLT